DRMSARYERELLAQVADRFPGAVDDLASAPAEQRHLAYLEWACRAELSAADLVIFADPHLRVTLTERWQEQVETWLHVPAVAGPVRRARLLAVRLMADGLWFDRAAGLLDEVGAEAERLRSLAADLLEEPAAAAPPGEAVRWRPGCCWPRRSSPRSPRRSRCAVPSTTRRCTSSWSSATCSPSPSSPRRSAAAWASPSPTGSGARSGWCSPPARRPCCSGSR